MDPWGQSVHGYQGINKTRRIGTAKSCVPDLKNPLTELKLAQQPVRVGGYQIDPENPITDAIASWTGAFRIHTVAIVLQNLLCSIARDDMHRSLPDRSTYNRFSLFFRITRSRKNCQTSVGSYPSRQAEFRSTRNMGRRLLGLIVLCPRPPFLTPVQIAVHSQERSVGARGRGFPTSPS
eukprot:1404527-Rhodomonas_salina.4